MVQSQATQSWTIAALARAGGVGVETIRYYQRRDLIRVPPREGTNIRRYQSEDLRRLLFIRQAQTAGFTLEEISELLALDATRGRSRAQEIAKARIAALDHRIEELTVARDALRKLARVCGAGTKGPCPIISAFE